MSRGTHWLLVLGTFAGSTLLACSQMAAQTKPSRLDTVLRQMDAGSAKFQAAQADFQKDEYEKIVHDTSSESGKIFFIRKAGSTQMGAKSPSQVVEYKNGKVRLLKANHIAEYSAAGHEAMVQTVLTLGFGGSGRELTQAWTIDDQGTETIDGVTTEKLDLVSKDAGMRGEYPHVTIWIDPIRDVALKQIFFEKSGNTSTATYKNIVLKKTVDTSAFAIKCNGKCD